MEGWQETAEAKQREGNSHMRVGRNGDKIVPDGFGWLLFEFVMLFPVTNIPIDAIVKLATSSAT
jgi:hypothetical protein